MPNTNDPLRTTDHDPSAAPPPLEVTGDFMPGSSTVEVATGAFVPGQDAEPKGAELECGSASVSVPGYEIEGVLGRGGMGIVYRARQVRANRLVALKMIRSAELADENERERFRKEAEAIASLDHRAVILPLGSPQCCASHHI
jgi:serine/threonine-protein kinase